LSVLFIVLIPLPAVNREGEKRRGKKEEGKILSTTPLMISKLYISTPAIQFGFGGKRRRKKKKGKGREKRRGQSYLYPAP